MDSTIAEQADDKPGVVVRSPDAGPEDPTPTDEERAAATAVLRMIWGMHVSRALYAVTELGIADRLANGPVSNPYWPATPARTSPRCTASCGCWLPSAYSAKRRPGRSA
jgi:hypothetical protein